MFWNYLIVCRKKIIKIFFDIISIERSYCHSNSTQVAPGINGYERIANSANHSSQAHKSLRKFTKKTKLFLKQRCDCLKKKKNMEFFQKINSLAEPYILKNILKNLAEPYILKNILKNMEFFQKINSLAEPYILKKQKKKTILW